MAKNQQANIIPRPKANTEAGIALRKLINDKDPRIEEIKKQFPHWFKNKWTLESAMIEAKKYGSKKEFRENNSFACVYLCKKNKEIFNKIFEKKVLTKENCILIMKQYKSRVDFKKGNLTAYKFLKKYHKETFELLPTQNTYWDREKAINIAKEYKSRSDLQDNRPEVYIYLRVNHYDVFDILYGLSQKQKHLTKESAIKIYEKESDAKIRYKAYRFLYKHHPETLPELLKKKKERRKENNTISLQDLKTEALNYKSRNEFRIQSPKFYNYALIHKLLDEICLHMKILTKWTKESALELASNYKSKRQFYLNYSGALEFLKKNYPEELDKVLPNKRERPQKLNVWTKELALKIAKNYKTRGMLNEEYPGAYRFLKKNYPEELDKVLPLKTEI